VFGRLTGDSYDHALAESVNRLLKTELFRRQGLRRSLEHVEPATADWVAWWNHTRRHSTIGDIPPADFEVTTIISARPLTPRDSKPLSSYKLRASS